MIFVWISALMSLVTIIGIVLRKRFNKTGLRLLVRWALVSFGFALLGEVELFFPGAIL